jgi:hypothetical protein
MSKTIDLLFDNIFNDTIHDLHPCIICDYFGFENIKYDDNIDIIYGIYEGLIKIKGISKKLIENCFFTNRLDELIHKKHIHHKSKYYQIFCDKQIQIGKTFDNDNKNIIDIQEIYDDNHCPTCNVNDYIVSNYISPPDCQKCCNNICKLCSTYCNIDDSYICYKCENPNLEKSIKNKISGYKRQDKDKFGFEGNILFEDVKELLRKQKFKCYVCDDIVISAGWKPNCLYQFTLDRINNSLPHNKDNVLICCYYCNCKDIMLSLTENIIDIDNIKNKICKNKCHCIKRIITIDRNNISNEKIEQLKLN